MTDNQPTDNQSTKDRPTNGTIDTTVPNVARVWDYQLGGKDNFAADRAAADAINQACRAVGAPDGTVVARENRDFIRRAVSYLAGPAGITQFIDIGAGLPTQGNVHNIAQQVNPHANVVYVDYDPLVLAHARALLATNDNTTVITADLRRPDEILDHPDLAGFIDLTKPVAVLLVAVLHLLTDAEDAAGIVARLRDAMAPGSYLAITHMTGEARPNLAAKLAAEFARLQVSTPLVPRTRQQIGQFFTGLDLVGPGMIFPTRWEPDRAGDDPGARWMYAGVGRKPTQPARPARTVQPASSARPAQAVEAGGRR
jgi:SAM-dependent methyltransferase